MVLMVLTALPITAILLSTTIYITEAVGSATATCDDANINNHPKKPNVVILFADNLGFNDVGAFRTANSTGSSTASSVERSRTPRTDQLANDGLKLMHWNSPAVLCSASRAGLMTGKYSVRTGIYPGVFKPDAEFGLLANETVRQKTTKDSLGFVNLTLVQCSLLLLFIIEWFAHNSYHIHFVTKTFIQSTDYCRLFERGRICNKNSRKMASRLEARFLTHR